MDSYTDLPAQPNASMKYQVTVAAYRTAHKSEWKILDALLLEVQTNPGSGRARHGEIRRVHDAVGAAGIDVAYATVQRQYWTAQWVDEAESQHAETIRSKGWTWAQRAMEAGWTPEQLVHHIATGGTTTGIERRVEEVVETLDDRAQAWIQNANLLFMKGARLEEDIENADIVEESVYLGIFRLLYQRSTESFIDAEIRQLLEEEAS